MRGATLRKWRGKRLQVLLDRKDDDFHDWYMNALKLSWFILLNSLLIVPAAICPPLARYRSWGFGSMFPDGGYLLHAWRALLPHPVTGEMVPFTAAPPPRLRAESEG